VAAALKELIAARAPKVASCEVFASTLAYVAGLCAALQDTKNFEFDEWNGVASTPYLASFMPEAEAEAVTRAYLVSMERVSSTPDGSVYVVFEVNPSLAQTVAVDKHTTAVDSWGWSSSNQQQQLLCERLC
jgi:hypothetical protein